MAGWFATQALAVSLFWPALLLVPQLRDRLVTGGLDGPGLWAFSAADLTISLTSVVAAIAVMHACQNAWLAMLLNVGASAYPASYFTALAFGGSGGEGAALMMGGLTLTSTILLVASLPYDRRLPSRQARAAGIVWLLLKTTGELLIIEAAFVVVVPRLLAGLDEAFAWKVAVSATQTVVGWVSLAIGGLLMAWSAYHMAWRGRGTPFPLDSPPRLIVDGPYRYVRNPQVVGGLIQGVGLLLLNPTFTFVAYLTAGMALWQLVLRPWEEADLLARFGPDYAAYQARVSCWRPTFGRSQA